MLCVALTSQVGLETYEMCYYHPSGFCFYLTTLSELSPSTAHAAEDPLSALSSPFLPRCRVAAPQAASAGGLRARRGRASAGAALGAPGREALRAAPGAVFTFRGAGRVPGRAVAAGPAAAVRESGGSGGRSPAGTMSGECGRAGPLRPGPAGRCGGWRGQSVPRGVRAGAALPSFPPAAPWCRAWDTWVSYHHTPVLIPAPRVPSKGRFNPF